MIMLNNSYKKSVRGRFNTIEQQL